MSTTAAVSHRIPLANGCCLRIECLDAGIFRVRAGAGPCDGESGLNRYGIIGIEPAPAASAAQVREAPGEWALAAPDATLRVRTEDGSLCLLDAAGRVLTRVEPPGAGPAGQGFEAGFRLAGGERLYGLGDVDRTCIQRRGGRYEMRIRNVTSYAPIPFVMSSAGWAVFLNTTWFHAVDAGAARPDRLAFQARQGALDYYLMAGAFPRGLLDRYTRVTGRPALLPAWGYGLTFICDDRGLRARDMLYEAFEFRRQHIPCDIIGLEPGWMETNYDLSVDKAWNKERFHIPAYAKGKRDHGTFAAALRAMGFKLSLWLCCDYDLTEHEERQLRARAAAGRAAVPGAEPAPDAAIDDERLKGARYMDTLTKPGVAWFEHLKPFVDEGARAFKLDACAQVQQHPDRTWYNGMADDELHNLHPVLYAKQMARGFAGHTGLRPMINIALGYAGIQQYAAMWAGDTGGGVKPLTSLLNHGCGGHSNVTTDMQVWNEAGIHFGFLQAWCQINSWWTYNQPWFQGEHLAAVFRDYCRWRYRLLPYVYSMAHVAHRTGLPIMRAMPLMFPDDPASDGCLLQYMFGEALLAGAFTDRIHLPAGEWYDYWTGAKRLGPATIPAVWPDGKGGPLFARAGAIIPMGPEQAHWGQKPLDTLWLDMFPGPRDEPFVLYEDDGETEAYRRGAVAATVFQLEGTASGWRLTAAPREGRYDGMPERRRYVIQVHGPRPRRVCLGRNTLDGWQYAEGASLLTLPELEAPAAAPLVVTLDMA